MPRIDDPVPSVKFKKKSYRPWGENLFGESPIAAVKTEPPHFLQEKQDKPEESLLKTVSETTGLNTLLEKGKDKPSVTSDERNKIKLGNNKGTIREQLDNELENNKESIREHKGNTGKTDKGTIRKQLGSELENNWETKTNVQVVEFETIIERVQTITGHQKKILFFIVDDCICVGELTTGQISNETLRNLLNTDSSTVKESVKRLIKKGLIERKGGKRGRGGFARYTLTDTVKKAVIQEKKKISIGKQLGNELENNWGVDRGTNASSSSSNIFKTTTTIESHIPDDWKNVDIEPLKEINFTVGHLKQIISQQKLSLEQVQVSIYAFAFDLNENGKAKKITTDPLSFFIGILKKGDPYSPPSNYVSPRDKALKLYNERMRELNAKRSVEEQTAQEYAFAEWSETVPEQEIKKISPTFSKGSTGFISVLKDFFLKNIWPQKKQEIMGLNQSKLEETSS